MQGRHRKDDPPRDLSREEVETFQNKGFELLMESIQALFASMQTLIVQQP